MTQPQSVHARDHEPVVVVGSGPGGLAAVHAFCERQPDRPVLLVTADPHPPYARPPLTKDFATGESGHDDLWLTDPDWFDTHDVGLRLGTQVMDLDRARGRLRLSDGSTQRYSQLVLATGSRPYPLPVPGGDHPEVVLVRDLASGIRLRELAATGSRVAVVGAGFIGCEAAASLAGRGNDVVLVTQEAVPHEKRLGVDAGRRIARWLTDDGVDLRTSVSVEALRRVGSGWEIGLGDGSVVRADAVVTGSGARPNVELAARSGLALTEGAVPTDRGMRTADPSIFAVGDIAYAEHRLAGRSLRVEHWGDAEEQGRAAGIQAAGGDAGWESVPGFWSTIGSHTLTYAAWGDGFDDYRVDDGPDGSWTVWYRAGDELAGVLAVGDESAYERGRDQLAARTPFAQAG